MVERELPGLPSMPLLFARAGAAAIPGGLRLPFAGGRASEIPQLALIAGDVEVDRRRLAAYDRVCSFGLRDTLPPTYPHVLAFPLQLALMTDSSFPFGVVGLVQIANRIVQHRPVDARERLALRVWATPAEPDPRGTRFSIRSEARTGDELVWEETSTNLHRGRGDGAAPAPDGPPSGAELPATATWRLPGDLGRRYGSVSGDRNPIHLHPLTARPFGFASAIAHGMWTKARCLAALHPQLPQAFTVQVAFKRPILLPGTVSFAELRAGDGIRFGVRDARRETRHLDGLVTV